MSLRQTACKSVLFHRGNYSFMCSELVHTDMYDYGISVIKYISLFLCCITVKDPIFSPRLSKEHFKKNKLCELYIVNGKQLTMLNIILPFRNIFRITFLILDKETYDIFTLFKVKI